MNRGEDGEFDGTRGKDNKQLISKQKQMIKNHDLQIDEIGGIVSSLKYNGQNFDQEVNYHNKILGKLNTDIDKTHNKMVKVDSKLKELISKSS